MARVIILWATFICLGCGTYQVRHGPESCSVARSYDSGFGAARGNSFDFNGDTAEIGLVAQEGRATSLRVLLTVAGVVDDVVAQGATIRLAIDGGVLEIPVGREAAPVSNVRRSGDITTHWVVLGRVDDATLQALTRAPVEALRLTMPHGTRQLTIPPGVGARLQTLAICLVGRYSIQRRRFLSRRRGSGRRYATQSLATAWNPSEERKGPSVVAL